MARSRRPLAHLWALQTVLLVCVALGCSQRPAPPAPDDPDTVDDKKEEKKADDKTKAKKERTGMPAEMLVGKWESAKQDQGFEFFADGTVQRTLYRRLPATGTYKLIDKTVELKFPADEKAYRHAFAVTPTTLTFTTLDKDPQKVEFKAVETYSAGLDNPNKKPNDKQRKWIVGTWLGVEKEFGKEDKYQHAFYSDGTFSVLKYSAFHRRTELEQGTYRVHPDADNFIELKYPDTGKTEAVYAEIGEKELALVAFWGFGKELRKHRRVEDKEERVKPIRDGMLTPFALFRECAAAPDKSKQKYAGKTIELVGAVGGHLSINGKSEIHLLTGNASRVRCQLDVKDKGTADALREQTFASILDGAVRIVTVRGKFDGVVKEEDKAAKIVSGIVGGEPLDKGPQLVVRLSDCKIAARSDVNLK